MKLPVFTRLVAIGSLTLCAAPASALFGGIISIFGGGQSGPTQPSLCDKYSTALFNSTEAKDQLTLLTALVNTALIGSFSPLGDKNDVTGILNDG